MSLNRFRATMSKSGGYARPSKFVVRVHPPAGGKLQELHKNMANQLSFNCNSVEMPGHDLQTQQLQHGSAPVRDMVTSHAYEGRISASFYLSADLRERHFFEKWQSMAVNKDSHKANYYDDYIGSMEIYQLSQETDFAEFKLPGRVGSRVKGALNHIFDRDIATYGIVATEVYPATISGIEYSYASGNQIATMAVGFNYREWRNIGDKVPGFRPFS